MPREAFIGLGSNLGDRIGFLRQAIEALHGSAVQVLQVSSCYESAPLGPVTRQPDFINAVARVRTLLEPGQLLACCHGVEGALGRQRELPKGPRTIDLDLLLMDELVLEDPRLTLPHPGMTSRAFVLAPLLEIAPQLRDPRDNVPLIRHLESAARAQRIKRLEGVLLGEDLHLGSDLERVPSTD